MAATVRRLRDARRSGWNFLWGIIPIGELAVLIMDAGASSTDESYGAHPGTTDSLPAV
ncbi:DUF805 domain-containing protein [Streptomyces hundungensis]|uniref:DUF805 domain-containing protein n=1 Tax=Streptomyces hundungensis TaxID=1077946 RepID=UPI003F541EFB